MLRIREGFSGERSVVLPEVIQNTCKEDEFISQLYITDIGYYPHAMYHYRERPEGVGQYILIYCFKGSGWYEVLGHHYEVKKNQWFVIPQGEPHVYASNNNDPWTIYWVHFTGKMASFYGNNRFVPSDISTSATSRIAERNELFEEIFGVLTDGYNVNNMRYASSLLYTYLATFCYLKNYRDYRPQSERIDSSDIVKMAVRFMMEHIEKTLTLAEISDYIGYSTSQFSLLFKNSTGHSPLNYFNMLKIQEACKWLENSDLKINQICSKVGIDDSYYFSRLFTKIVGVSPKKYRQRTTTDKLSQ